MSPTEQTDWRELGPAAQMAATALQAAKAAQQAALQNAVAWEVLVDIVYKDPITLSFAPRVKTFDVADAKAGDLVYVHLRAPIMLAGVSLLGGVLLQSTGTAFVDKKVDVYHIVPGVGLGQTLTVPLRIRGSRPVSA